MEIQDFEVVKGITGLRVRKVVRVGEKEEKSYD